MEYKTILLTGGTGYLGSLIAKMLLQNGYRVAVLTRNTSDLKRLADFKHHIDLLNTDQLTLEACVEKVNPAIVIHCATDYGRKFSDPGIIASANLLFPLKLLHLCKKHHIKCFINTDTALDKNVNAYSLSKFQFKEWLHVYSTDMICVNMMLEHFYGPGEDTSKFVAMIIDKMLAPAAEIDLTTGEQKRDFIYIDDVVQAFLIVIKKTFSLQKGFYHFGVGTKAPVTIKAIVELIKLLCNNEQTRLNLGAIPSRKKEIKESIIDTTALHELGWNPEYSLIDGLQKTINIEIEHKQ